MPNVKGKILFVDDERASCATLAAIFESQSYEIATAYSGEEAIEVASSFQPDCVVSDVMMGGMNGIEAAIEIVNALPQCKVLFMSGNAPCQDLLGNAIAKGFNFEILMKPVPVPELLSRISQIFLTQTTKPINVLTTAANFRCLLRSWVRSNPFAR